MSGITMKELCDYISQWHEVKFTYNNEKYVIQPEVINGKSYLVIWNCEEDGVCIYRYSIPNHETIAQDLIGLVLNEKCFDGKSFYEIESEITVSNNIFNSALILETKKWFTVPLLHHLRKSLDVILFNE